MAWQEIIIRLIIGFRVRATLVSNFASTSRTQRRKKSLPADYRGGNFIAPARTGGLNARECWVARFNHGYIKLYRSLLDSDLADNLSLLGLWVALLKMATWKPSSILWCGKRREIPPGTVVFGMRELAMRFGCSHMTISRWVKYLHDSGRITLESGTRGCLATICNWKQYQGNEESDVPLTLHGCSTDVPLTGPYEESKKERRNTAHASHAESSSVKNLTNGESLPQPLPSVGSGVSSKKKKDIARGAIDALKGHARLDEALSTVSQAAQEGWLEMYPDPAWVRRELLACANFYESKGETVKSMGQAMAGWLKRGHGYLEDKAKNAPKRSASASWQPSWDGVEKKTRS